LRLSDELREFIEKTKKIPADSEKIGGAHSK
jgi:hypothetical protein